MLIPARENQIDVVIATVLTYILKTFVHSDFLIIELEVAAIRNGK